MQDLEILQNKLRSNSVLNFTIELNNNKYLRFLDTFYTKIYRKENDALICLNDIK